LFTTLPYAGQTLTGTLLSTLFSEIRPVAAVKTADEARTSSTYIGDSHLTVTIPAADTYNFELLLIYNGPSGGTNGRLKVRINFPTGALSVGHVGGKNNTAVTDANMTDIDLGAVYNATSSPTSDISLPTVGTSVDLTAIIQGTLVCTSVATLNTFSIDTAQIATSGTTTIRKHSSLIVRRLGL
jgi:hypothetical protein